MNSTTRANRNCSTEIGPPDYAGLRPLKLKTESKELRLLSFDGVVVIFVAVGYQIRRFLVRNKPTKRAEPSWPAK